MLRGSGVVRGNWRHNKSCPKTANRVFQGALWKTITQAGHVPGRGGWVITKVHLLGWRALIALWVACSSIGALTGDRTTWFLAAEAQLHDKFKIVFIRSYLFGGWPAHFGHKERDRHKDLALIDRSRNSLKHCGFGLVVRIFKLHPKVVQNSPTCSGWVFDQNTIHPATVLVQVAITKQMKCKLIAGWLLVEN